MSFSVDDILRAVDRLEAIERPHMEVRSNVVLGRRGDKVIVVPAPYGGHDLIDLPASAVREVDPELEP